MISGTASPSRAARMVGASRSAMGRRPNFSCSANQPSAAPGTVQDSGVRSLMVPSASGLTLSAVSARGARPEAFRPYSFWVFASHTIAKRSPPIPHDIGSSRPRAALTAMAASAALPPFFRTSTPICTARGCAAATMPCRA
jgi:hypothetical protein